MPFTCVTCGGGSDPGSANLRPKKLCSWRRHEVLFRIYFIYNILIYIINLLGLTLINGLAENIISRNEDNLEYTEEQGQQWLAIFQLEIQLANYLKIESVLSSDLLIRTSHNSLCSSERKWSSLFLISWNRKCALFPYLCTHVFVFSSSYLVREPPCGHLVLCHNSFPVYSTT